MQSPDFCQIHLNSNWIQPLLQYSQSLGSELRNIFMVIFPDTLPIGSHWITRYLGCLVWCTILFSWLPRGWVILFSIAVISYLCKAFHLAFYIEFLPEELLITFKISMAAEDWIAPFSKVWYQFNNLLALLHKFVPLHPNIVTLNISVKFYLVCNDSFVIKPWICWWKVNCPKGQFFLVHCRFIENASKLSKCFS